MPFLSELLNAPVLDRRHERIGKVAEVLASPTLPYPTVSGITISSGKATWRVPWGEVAQLNARETQLNVDRQELAADVSSPADRDLRLMRDVLDKQIVDVDGVRLVRANDLHLTQHNGHMHVMGIDVSGKALIRRLGMGALAQRVASRLPDTMISWENVEAVTTGSSAVRLKVSGRTLATVHPADLASVVDQLPVAEGSALMEALDTETAADTMEEVAPERQVSLLQGMESGKAADILEAMGPDDAADVLGDMADAKAEELLNLMEAPEAREVQELLGYPEDSAGGIMTTDYLAAPEDLTAQAAIDELRAKKSPVEMAYYVYVVQDRESERLVGVVTLHDLILADPASPLRSVMAANPIAVNVHDHQHDVARVIGRYNLMAVPVVNDEYRLQGIVTVDDAIDILLPTAWKKRLPRVFARPTSAAAV